MAKKTQEGTVTPDFGVDIPSSTGYIRFERATDGGITLFVNGFPSSELKLDPTQLAFPYMDWMFAAIETVFPAMVIPNLRVTHLGGGACSLARCIHSVYPSSRQIVIELDTTLAENVRNWFELPRSPQLKIRSGDAVVELPKLPAGRCDVLIRDVFAENITPASLCDKSAAEAARAALAPDGIYLVNCASEASSGNAVAEFQALRSAFSLIEMFGADPVLRGRKTGNIVFLCSNRANWNADLESALRRRGLAMDGNSSKGTQAFLKRASQL